MFSKIWAKISDAGLDNKLRAYFLKGSVWGFLLQMGLAALTLLTSLLIARWAGDAEFGAYSAVSNWVSLWAMLILAGVDDLLIKQIPIYQQTDNQLFTRKLFRWAWVYSALFFAVFSLGLIILLEFNLVENWVGNKPLLYLGLLVLFFYTQIFIFQAAFRGFKSVKNAQLGDKIIQPLLFFVLLAGFLPFFQLTDFWAMLFRLASLAIAALVIYYLLRKKYSFLFVKNVRNQEESGKKGLNTEQKIWKKTSFYFMLISFLYAVNSRADVAALDLLRVDFAQIGYYNAAARLSDLLNLPFLVVSAVAMPIFSQLYHDKNFTKLQTFFTQITFISFFLSLIGFIFFYFLGNWLLTWFGTGFVRGYSVLMLGALSKLLHAFFGASNYLLMMCGQEKKATISLIISVLISVICQIYLIPIWGIEGAAWANLISLLIFELIQAYMLWRYVQIRPSVLAFYSNGKK